jgi:hypothetical protein
MIATKYDTKISEITLCTINIISIIITCYMTIIHGNDICKLSHNILVLALWGVFNCFISASTNILLVYRSKDTRDLYKIITIIFVVLSFISSIGIVNYFVFYKFYSNNYSDCNKVYYYTVLCNCIISIIHISILFIYIIFWCLYCYCYSSYIIIFTICCGKQNTINREEIKHLIKNTESDSELISDSSSNNSHTESHESENANLQFVTIDINVS